MPVLLLLSLLGLLVVATTPIHQVPARLSALCDTVLRREPAGAQRSEAEDPPPALEPLRRRGPRRRVASLEQQGSPEDVSPVVVQPVAPAADPEPAPVVPPQHSPRQTGDSPLP